jgi:hypothetical protein
MPTRSEKWAENFELTAEQAHLFGRALGEALAKGFEMGIQVDQADFLDPDKSEAIMTEMVQAQIEWFMEEVPDQTD